MEIVRLNTLSIDKMKSILEEERHHLMLKFQWDTQYSFKLKTQLLKYGRLDGLDTVENGKCIGYLYWHHFESEFYLSGYYFSLSAPSDSLLHFLNHASDFIIENFPKAVIEGQLLCIDDSVKSDVFERNRFITIARDYMKKDLTLFIKKETESIPQTGLKISVLSNEGYDRIDDLADSMYKSYKGTIDEWITRSFGSFRGCRNFISNLYEFPVYGKLLEDLSIVISDDQNEILAMILVCKSSNITAHLVQVSVIPEYQSKGIGKFIINECLAGLVGAGYKNAVLMVTSENIRAFNLYKKIGFETISKFYSINYNKIKTPLGRGVW